MTNKFVATLTFSPNLRDKWPKSVLTAEARLNVDSDGSEGPWSLRAELWAPPDAEGRALAWVYFLSPEAPIHQPLVKEFDLTLGSVRVAKCRIQVMSPPNPRVAVERDFLEQPDEAVRVRAA